MRLAMILLLASATAFGQTHPLPTGYGRLKYDCIAISDGSPCQVTILTGYFVVGKEEKAVCISDPVFPERAEVLAVKGSRITLKIYSSHPAGSYLFQGGSCGKIKKIGLM